MASPLRLVIVTRRFWPIAGAAERAIANLAAELVLRGVQVTLLTIRWEESWPQRIDYRGIAVIRLPRGGRGFLGTRRWLSSLSRYLRDHGANFDAAYVRGMRHEAQTVLKQKHRYIVVLRADGSGRLGDCLWQLDSATGRQIKRRVMRADAFVAPTEISHRELKAAGYPRDRIHRIVGGVSVGLSPDTRTKLAARWALENVNTLLHCPPDTPVAVYTGRLNDPLGPACAIDAWRVVARRWPNARLWLIGADANQSEMNRRIESAGLTGRVVLPGVFADVSELLAAADAAVVDDDSDDSSALMLEAMAAGLPIAAVDTPEHRCLVEDRKSALLYPPGDSDRLGDVLVGMFDHVPDAKRLGAAARALAKQQYEIEQVADTHLRLLAELVQSKRGIV